MLPGSAEIMIFSVPITVSLTQESIDGACDTFGPGASIFLQAVIRHAPLSHGHPDEEWWLISHFPGYRGLSGKVQSAKSRFDTTTRFQNGDVICIQNEHLWIILGAIRIPKLFSKSNDLVKVRIVCKRTDEFAQPIALPFGG
jgi:hypothetical protein